LKISGKLIFLIVLIAVGIGSLYLTTTSQQRSSGIAYGQGWLAFKFKNYPRAVRHYTNAVQRDPSNLMALYFTTLSKIKTAEGSIKTQEDSHYFREAVHHGKELVSLGEESKHKNLYLFYYVSALAHLHVHEYDSAKEAIEKARDLVPDDYRILVLAGRILIEKEDYKTAIVHLDGARQEKSYKAYEAYFYLGLAHEGLGDRDRAWFYYDQCIKSWPTKEMKQEAIRKKTAIVSKPGP